MQPGTPLGTRRPASPLDLYRASLPKREFAALEAWLSTFYPFQRRWILDPSKLAICNKSRQIGLSHSTAAVGVVWGAFHGDLTTIISIGERESGEVLDRARKHAAVLVRLGSEMAKTGRRDNAEEISFASGGRILALPSSAGRSFSGNVFLDEYAYQEHADKVWDAAAAVTMLGWHLRVASTPNGVGNDFHRLWELATGDDPGWSAHEIPIDVAVKEGFPVDLAKCWTLAKNDPRLFDQLFRCSFLDNALQYIPTEDIRRCEVGDDLTKSPGEEHYAGLDIGRSNDLTVLVVLRFFRGTLTVVHIETAKRTESDAIKAMVDRAFARYRIKRLCIDATGLGTFPAADIKRKHSERVDVPYRRPRVELVNFTLKSKESLATGMYSAITGGSLVLPASDASLPTIDLGNGKAANLPGVAEMLRKDIASIRRIVTKAGNVTYDAPRTEQGHADSAWALAMGIFASTGRNAMFDAVMSKQVAR